MPKRGVRVALVTTPSAALAGRLAKGLVKGRLAACVSVVPGLVSHYYWKGRLEADREHLLVIKTRAALMPRLIAWVRKNHVAQVPEIISLPVAEGDRDYLRWLQDNTRRPRR